MPHQKGHVITGQGGRRFKRKAAFADKSNKNKVAETAKTTTKKTSNWRNPGPKKLVQAGALITGALDRGSSGGIAGSIIGFDDDDTNNARGKGLDNNKTNDLYGE